MFTRIRTTSTREFVIALIAMALVITAHFTLLKQGMMLTNSELSFAYPAAFLAFNFVLSKMLSKKATDDQKKYVP